MPEGRIQSFDNDTGEGTLIGNDADSAHVFSRDVLKDYKTGELVHSGQRVTFRVEDDTVVSVHRVVTRGYE